MGCDTSQIRQTYFLGVFHNHILNAFVFSIYTKMSVFIATTISRWLNSYEISSGITLSVVLCGNCISLEGRNHYPEAAVCEYWDISKIDIRSSLNARKLNVTVPLVLLCHHSSPGKNMTIGGISRLLVHPCKSRFWCLKGLVLDTHLGK